MEAFSCTSCTVLSGTWHEHPCRGNADVSAHISLCDVRIARPIWPHPYRDGALNENGGAVLFCSQQGFAGYLVVLEALVAFWPQSSGSLKSNLGLCKVKQS